MYNFTPLSALTGGLIIGCAVVLYFYTTGRLAGISGIFANAFTSKANRSSNILFLLGLVLGPLGYFYFSKTPVNFEISKGYQTWKEAFLKNEAMRQRHNVKVLAYGH